MATAAVVGAAAGGIIGASGVVAGVGIATGVLAGAAIGGAFDSYRAQRKQEAALGRAADAREEAAAAQRRQAAIQNRQAAIRQVIAARRARAQTAAQGVQGGTLQSSGVQGAQSSASAQASGNLGTMRALSTADTQRFQSLQRAYSFDAAAQRFGLQAQQSAQLSRTAISASGSSFAGQADQSFQNFIG